MPTKIEKDAVTGTDTTGHEWDGIKELNTPLPKWWLYTMYATIVWGFIWMLLYPSVPLGTTYFKGLLGYSERAEIAASLKAAADQHAPMLTQLAQTPIEDVQKNPDLATFALTGGRAVFADNCAPCHGPGGSGRPGGFPVLADDDWLWGGTREAIQLTLQHGIRNGSPDARDSAMPRYGADGLLTPAQIADVADYVLALATPPGTALSPEAKRGAAIYGEQCVACHGVKGEGLQEFGAPRLSDAIWLYGGDRAALIRQISAPRQGVMPAWSGRLTDAQIKMLTLYVHSLGGGQ
ncbi:MAG: cytochrome-c oxidase, cbb3-type subunit III [Elstera sp.]